MVATRLGNWIGDNGEHEHKLEIDVSHYLFWHLAQHQEHVEAMVADDQCPKCRGELDTGWECNDCGFDAMSIAKQIPVKKPNGAKHAGANEPQGERAE